MNVNVIMNSFGLWTDRKEVAEELEEIIHMAKAPLALQAGPSFTLPKVSEEIKIKEAIDDAMEPKHLVNENIS